MLPLGLRQPTPQERDEGIRFVSVQAALDYMVSLRPAIEEMVERMDRNPGLRSEFYESHKSLVAVLREPEKLRALLEQEKEPDGTVRLELD